MWRNVMMMAVVLSYASNATAQICKTTIPRSAPDTRYQIVAGSQGAEVRDLYTQLIWQRCSVGQQWDGTTCTGQAQTFSWIDALKAGSSQQGWRLPNIRELQTLVEDACADSSINYVIFPNTPAQDYWTSSPSISSPNQAWAVSFSVGLWGAFPLKTSLLPIRLVKTP